MLVKVMGPRYHELFRVVNILSKKVKEVLFLIGEDIDRDGVDCQLYSPWRRVK